MENATIIGSENLVRIVDLILKNAKNKINTINKYVDAIIRK